MLACFYSYIIFFCELYFYVMNTHFIHIYGINILLKESQSVWAECEDGLIYGVSVRKGSGEKQF